jgi:hypothetical protein
MPAPTESPPPNDLSTGSGAATGEGRSGSAPSPAGTAGRMPEFFIVGHEKSGTTALYEILRRHPEIFMPDLKEPRFFMRDAATETTGAGVRPHTLEGYLSLFAAASSGQRVGEASPQYIRSPDAVRRIAEAQPQARIIALLREPTSFLRSYHLENLASAIESERDLRKAMALEQRRRQGESIPRGCEAPDRLLYSEHVQYATQLRRLHAAFGRERVLPLIYEDFRRDNTGVVGEVLRFLEVDDSLPLEPVEVVSAKRRDVRFMSLHHATRALKRARHNPANSGRVSRAVSALAGGMLAHPRVVRSWRRLVYAVPAPPDEQFVLELRHRFKPEVVALSEYLERDLVTLWGYDRIS